MSQPADIQERIAAARRESEQLKEKIRARRELTNDTSRKCFASLRPRSPRIFTNAFIYDFSESHGARSRGLATHSHADTETP